MHGWRFGNQVAPHKQFFNTHVGNRKAVCFIREGSAIAQMYLAAEPTIKLAAVTVYEIHVGAVGGMSIGYLMCSPLSVVVDPYFALYHRRQYDPYMSLKEGAEGSNRYQLRGGISVFTVEDDAVMFAYHTPSKITEALEGT